MPSLRFRLPGRTRSVGDWLSRLLPSLDRSSRRRLIEGRCIRVEGRIVDRPNTLCRAGACVEIEDLPSELLPVLSTARSSAWFVWVDEPPWFGGALDLGDQRKLEFHVEDRERGLALLAVSGPECDAAELCRALADVGMPVVGDLVHGGLARVGGAVMASTRADCCAEMPADEPAWPEPEPADASLVLRVSEQAARALRRGHPWLLPDDASDRAEVFRPGSQVRVEDRDGRMLGWAWLEGDSRLAARMAANGSLERRAISSVEARVARALGRRRELLEPNRPGPATDCYRLIHGEGDGLPGLYVDRLGCLLRVLVTGRASDGFRERAIAALRAQLPTTPEGTPWCVLEVLHLRGHGRGAAFDRLRWISGSPEALQQAGVETVDAGFWVQERGLRFAVAPGWDTPRRSRPGYGLFPDQRENRSRIAPLAALGGRWLNLFAHTGAFSAGLLASGAERVVSVDLSGSYLRRLETNLEANRDRGVDPARHQSMRADGRRYLETLERAESFAGIVIDPPTVAAAGRRFWSLRQDLEPLLRMAVERLDEGGALLVTQNRKGAPLGLEGMLARMTSRARRPVRDQIPAPAGVDYPTLAAFPEGDAFEGWLLTLE